MKSLLITQMPIWPVSRGAQLRLDLVHRSLARLGDVKVLSIERSTIPDPLQFDVATRSSIHLIPTPQRAPLRRWRWWLDPRSRPVYFFTRKAHWSRIAVAEWASGERFDVAWFSRVQTYHWFADLVDANLRVVDIDDLQGDKRMLELSDRLASARGPLARLRKLQGYEDSRRWEKLTKAIGERARVVACSAHDARKLSELGLDAYVVPNCYDRKGHPGPPSLPEAPRVLMQGSLPYGPNARGVEWLVNEVWPLVRLRIPDAELRLVGRANKAIERFADRPGVEVIGFVDDISMEVQNARVCVVPIHFGGGTRIKILEAFAHMRPVVSTTVGAAGLAVSHDHDILIADDPKSFAENVVRVLLDRSLAQRLAEAGFRTWSGQYTPTQFHTHVVSVVSADSSEAAQTEPR
jgi:glycosyltransferase involved in cell wall biosynthesis